MGAGGDSSCFFSLGNNFSIPSSLSISAENTMKLSMSGRVVEVVAWDIVSVITSFIKVVTARHCCFKV